MGKETVTVISRASNKYNGNEYPPGTEFDCDRETAKLLAKGKFVEIVKVEAGYSDAVREIVGAMTIKQIKAELEKRKVEYDRAAKKMELAEELAGTGFTTK